MTSRTAPRLAVAALAAGLAVGVAPSGAPVALAASASAPGLRAAARNLAAPGMLAAPQLRLLAALSEPFRLPGLRGVPWPIVLHTSGGRYLISRGGMLRLLPGRVHRPRIPADVVFVYGEPHTRAVIRARHLLILRHGAVVWRSARRYPVRRAGNMGTIVVGRAGVAFQLHQYGRWYAARWGHAEHRVAGNGWPELWTRSGDIIGVVHKRHTHRFGYAVFSPTGVRLETLASGLGVGEIDQRAGQPGPGLFWFLTRNGILYRSDGSAPVALASSRALGFSHLPYLSLLPGDLIQLLSADWRQGQAVLYPDGQLFARIPAPSSANAAGFGLLTTRPGGSAVVYALTKPGGVGATVYLVRPGRAPLDVYRTLRGDSACSLPVSWHGRWLMYVPQGSAPVLIDTAGRHRVIPLPVSFTGLGGRIVHVTSATWR